MSDPRSLESELHAFTYLKLDPNNPQHLVASESELIRLYASRGMRVPEAIFKLADGCITVEVKRIPGNSLPCEQGGPQRKLRRRERIIWPWTSTVVNAMKKTTPLLSREYGIVGHHVVFVIPNTLKRKARCRLQNHVLTTVNAFRDDKEVHPNVTIHIIDAPVEMFDRLCP
tara:strand:- start:1814 stop:2326 length:513 start_codon:yes stop_codon:yes gene_type:complete